MVEKLPSIHQLLPLVADGVGAVGKDRVNQQQNYRFRGIDDLLSAVHPVLSKYEVTIVPRVLDIRQNLSLRIGSSNKETEWERVTLTVEYVFYGPGGDSVSAVVVGSGLDNADKATNKALSAAMKYALIQVLSIPTEDIEDGDASSPNAPGQRVDRATGEIQAAPQGRAGSGASTDRSRPAPTNGVFKHLTQWLDAHGMGWGNEEVVEVLGDRPDPAILEEYVAEWLKAQGEGDPAKGVPVFKAQVERAVQGAKR